MNKRDRGPLTCYLCKTPIRKGVNRSDDHVPPKGMFPELSRYQLITVPCCIDCNLAHAETDELLLLLNNNYFAEKKFPEIEEKVLRAVREGKGLARHIPAFIASRGKDENGIEWVKMPIPHMRETMARMYKGLLYKFYGIRNFDGYHFFQCCMNPAARDHLLSENPPHLIRRFERGDGVFRADILSDPDVPYLIAIWIQFYTGTVYYGLYSLVSLPDGAPLEGS